MAHPTNRTEFKAYILKRLGSGALKVNVTDEQVEDRIDDALEYFYEFHQDATYTKWIYLEIDKDLHGEETEIVIPDEIVEIIDIRTPKDTFNVTGGLGNVSYLYRLSNFTNGGTPYTNGLSFYLMETNMKEMSYLFEPEIGFQYTVYGKTLRFNTTMNKLLPGIVFNAVVRVNPDAERFWADRWLRDYATALVKQQWGDVLKKFDGVELIGGVTMNGQALRDEADQEIEKLEQKMRDEHQDVMPVFWG